MQMNISTLRTVAFCLAASMSVSAMATVKGEAVFSEDFSAEDSFRKWTIVDNNGGRTWEYLNGMAAYMLDYDYDKGEPGERPGDDWLISPEFTLESGKVYDLRLYVGSLSKKENLRICIGKTDDPASMATVVADFKDMVKEQSGDKVFRLAMPEGGTYRLGFYAYSEPKQHRVEIDNVEITDAGSDKAPGPVEGLTVVRGEKGALSAKLSFTAPVSDAGLKDLASLSRIEIMRDAALIKCFEDIAKGEAVEWTDTSMPEGFSTYDVVAFNSYGDSDVASVTEYIGKDATLPVDSVFVKAETDKSVTVKWKAPAGTVNGGYADFSALTYKVVRSDGTVVSDGTMKDLEFNDPRPVRESQGLVFYTVNAVTEDGKVSEPRESNRVTAGEPLGLPYAESFAGMETSVPWTLDGQVNDMEWVLVPDDEEGEYEGVLTQDGDNGMLSVESRYADYGARSRMVSPMIDLSQASNPELKFWFHQGRSPWYDPEWEGEINDRIEVQISENGGDWKTLDNATFRVNDSPDNWIQCVVPLPRNSEGGYVNIGLLAIAESDDGAYRNMYVDNVAIDNALFDHDLALESFTAESLRPGIGDETEFSVRVLNRSNMPVDSYKVNIFRDGEAYMSIEGGAIDALAKVELAFAYLPVLADSEKQRIVWTAEIAYEEDQNAANNKSMPLEWSVRPPEVPSVTGLDGTVSGNEIALFWDESKSIDIPLRFEPVRIIDDFEDYDAFIIDNIGEYALWDLDGATTLVSPRIGRYPNVGKPMAFQVFNAEKAGVWTDDNKDFALRPHSGKQYLICPCSDYPAENDDWIVTPRLDGRAQTVSFWAAGVSFDSEWINVYYSTTDNHYDSFVKLNPEDRIYVQPVWKEYSFDVPDGTRYFAARCIRRTVILMLDDFSYNVFDGQPDEATFLGYNIYRDGERLNGDNLLTEALYIDKTVSEGRHSYRVSAVYEEGESSLCEPVEFDTSSVEAVESKGIRIMSSNGSIVIESERPVMVTVSAVDGKTVCQGIFEGHATYAMQPGVYIVNAGAETCKLVVK